MSTLLSFLFLLSGWSFWKSKPPMLGSATFSPDGQHLVFSIEYQGSENIYRIRKNGGELTKLTNSPGWDFDPVYSPDGSKIVFARIASSKYSDPADLYRMRSDGSDINRLTSGPFHEQFPVFSPDGKRIYFVRARWFGHHSLLATSKWKNKDIYSINLDGSDLRAVTSESFYGMSKPSISPSGKEILTSLVISTNPGSLDIIPIENSKARRTIRTNLEKYIREEESNSGKSSNTLPDPSQPQFSSDGKSILFVWAANKTGNFNYEIFTMNPRNGGEKKITNLKSYIAYPVFSADSKEIVFLSDFKRNGPYELWLVNSDGANPHKVNIDLNKCLNCANR